VNDVAKISEKLDHHGDIFFNYDTVKIEIYSHSHNGVTTKDIEFAKDVSKK
jgi:pterin-4a-carbinolamine dehydratase